MAIIEDKNRQQPREKLMEFGADALSDAELLAILLRTGTKGKPVVELAAEILSKYHDNLAELCDAGISELRQIQGMGFAKSVELCAAFALVKRLALRSIRTRPSMKDPKMIAKYMMGMFTEPRKEEFYVLLLDSQMCIMRCELVSVGLVDRSLVHPREVFRAAIRELCSVVILCHNHPGGSIMPSKEDVEITNMLCKAGEVVGIRVVDHIIVSTKDVAAAEPAFFSFNVAGIMPKPTPLNVVTH